MNEPTYVAEPGSYELVVTHRYEAPIDLVYKIFTDPKEIPNWWGPRDLSTTVERMDVRPGGSWRFIQRDAKGGTFPFNGVYHTVTPNKLIISTFEWEGMKDHVILETTRFEEHAGQTVVTQQDVFQSVMDRDGMIQSDMEIGIIESDERFKEILARLVPAERAGEPRMGEHVGDGHSLKITRIFNAPVEVVWSRWTNPDDYKCWWGPKDFSTPYARFDLRPGGKYLTSMRGPDGKDIWSTGVYKEIIELNRLVMTDSFADEHGNIVPATYYEMSTDIPLELEVDVTLEDIGGKTRLTLEHCGLPEGEILEQTWQGWSESFDKLEECLE
ncbi:MAG: SRPBCC domain-containing protein [Acidobacteriaceae bacterium]